MIGYYVRWVNLYKNLGFKSNSLIRHSLFNSKKWKKIFKIINIIWFSKSKRLNTLPTS